MPARAGTKPAALPGLWRLASGICSLHRLLLRHRATPRALARPRVGPGALAAHRQVAAVPQPAEAADLHQPLDVHRDVLAQVALDPALLLDHTADLPHVVFREVLDANVRA